MPLKLDYLDLLILKSLMEDGRKPFSVVAKEVGVSTPTVRNRVERMISSGTIRKFVPVVDVEKVENAASALIFLRVKFPHLSDVASYLERFDEVRGIYLTSGDSNLIVRLVVRDNKTLQDFLNRRLATMGHVSIKSVQIIMKTVKDETGFPPIEGLYVHLRCDTCGQEIKGEPVTLNVEGGKRFFCCKTCLSVYKEKFLKGL